MTEPLYPHQAEGMKAVVEDHAVYFGFDPGLGKSRAALAAAKLRGARRILVICLASGRYVWEQEAKKWMPEVPVWVIRGHGDMGYLKKDGIVVITYGLLSIKNSPFAAAVAQGSAFDFTVLDEATAVKSAGANRTKAVFEVMMKKLGYVLPLSGTPMQNHAGELYTVLRALYPKAITSASGKVLKQWEYEDRYCKVVSKRFGNGPSVRVIEGSKNLTELKERMRPFMIRVRKQDVLKDLPPVRYDVVPLGVSAPHTLPSLPVEIKDDDDFMKYLAGRVADEHVMRVRRMLGLAKATPAAEYIDDFLTNLPASRKLLVFAHHREVIETLVNTLGDWSPLSITGASSPDARSRAINSFLTDNRHRLLIGNIQAMGMGLTLVGPTCDCSDVVFVEAAYNPADNVQAAARVHRIGQKSAVVARFLTAHATIDDRIQSIIARKAGEFQQLFG